VLAAGAGGVARSLDGNGTTVSGSAMPESSTGARRVGKRGL